jgi:hypothetical protein
MMTGRIQVGYEDFVEVEPASLSAVGDPNTYPTYVDLQSLYQAPDANTPEETGVPATRLLQPDGSLTSFLDYQDDPATLLLDSPNAYGVPRGFLDFQHSYGIIYRDGRAEQAVQGPVYFPKFVFGFPVTRAYWVNSRVGGHDMPILFQVFERRVLTYNPANSPGARVEMGNVGQHYFNWRYTQLDMDMVPASDTTNDPASTPTPPPLSQHEEVNLFGMNTYITGLERNQEDRDTGVSRLLSLGREAGVDWAREELSWANLEPHQKGDMNYQYYDNRVLELAQSGYGIVGVLLTTPEWARVDDCTSRNGRIEDYWCPPANAQDYGDFVRTIVEHYDGDGMNDAPGSPRVAVWQLWNEPSTRGTWPGSPAEYGALMVAGYNGAKAADPSALVLTGGVYLYDGMGTDPNDGLPFLNEAFSAVPEAEGAFDALAIHPYMPTAAPDAPVIFSTITMWGRIDNAQRWLREHSRGGVPRPLWISEVGWSTCQTGRSGCNEYVSKTEEQQANYLVRTYAIALAQGVQHVSYFQLEDKFDGGSGVFWGEASVLSTDSEDYRQKPAYQAYRVLAQQLNGMRFMGFGTHNTFTYDPNIENPEALYHLRFESNSGELLDILWHNAGEQNVTFTSDEDRSAEWINRSGDVTPITGSSVSLTVNEQPVYVRQSP